MCLEVNKLLFSLLRAAISGVPFQGENSFSDERWRELFILSRKHDLAHLVAEGAEKSNLFPQDSEWIKVFQKERMKAVYRYEQLEYELVELCRVLEESEITFLPLKGAVLRGDYPEPWMRTSCDIDVLVAKEDLESAIKVLTERLGYTEKENTPHDVSLYSQSGNHIELHFDLMEEGSAKQANKVLENIWPYARAKAGYTYWQELTDEAFYFYHIAHMAKHMENGGCGIRPLLDLWILNHKKRMRQDELEPLLKEGGLTQFAIQMNLLAEIWFGEEQHTSVTQNLEDYILRAGVYGSMENRVTVQQVRQGGKVKYVFSRIFMPYAQLKLFYPVLVKHKWLYPFYQIRRWGRIIFCGRIKKSVRELKTGEKVTEEEKNATQEMLQSLGLQ